MNAVVYTTAELAERWGISVRVVERMLHDGTVKGFRVGSRWRITDTAVEAYENGK